MKKGWEWPIFKKVPETFFVSRSSSLNYNLISIWVAEIVMKSFLQFLTPFWPDSANQYSEVVTSCSF